jgi:ABC-type multidrug transport system fused ATPase/permease subunit/phosphoglycolate phosphatase-like HAD superfamily hydrolase
VKPKLRVTVELLLRCWRVAPRRSLAVLSLLVAESVAVGLLAVCLGLITDAALGGDLTTVVAGSIGAALCFLQLSMGTAARTAKLGYLGERVGVLIDEEILAATTDLPTLAHLEQPAYLDRIHVVLGRSPALVRSAWAPLVSGAGFAGIALSLVPLARIHPLLLGMVVLAVGPLWMNRVGSRWVRSAHLATAEDERVERDLFRLLTDAAAGQEIRVYGCGPELTRRRGALFRRVTDVQLTAQLRASAVTALGWSLFTAGYVGGLALLAVLVARGERTPGDVVLAVTLAAQLRSQVKRAFASVSEVTAALAVLESYLWVREYSRTRQAPAGPGTPPPARLADGITLDKLTFQYPNARGAAVRDVDVFLPAGSLIAVVGEYGSGKSTLVKLLLGLYPPSRGAVRVDGADIAAMDIAAWRSRCGVIFQDFGRYRTTLREAVALNDEALPADEHRWHEVIAAAGVDQVVASLPDGADTQLGSAFGGVELSEGQWQKVAIARSDRNRDPLLLVMDEPTAALDPVSETALFERYVRIARTQGRHTGAVSVVVSHRLSIAPQADAVLVMADGKAVEYGSHADLVRRGGRYADMYRVHRRVNNTRPWPELVIWDIDRTLLDAGPTTQDAFEAALREVWPRAAVRGGRNLTGRTDPAVVREVLLDSGMSSDEVDESVERVLAALPAQYVRRRDRFLAEGRVLPGVERVLRELSARQVSQTVLTGNVRANALLKLEMFGLGDVLDTEVGAYGDDAEQREDLLPLVLHRIAGRDGRHPPAERVWLIGDTPNDLACARRSGVRCLLVATGLYDRADLAGAGPDATMDDLSDWQELASVFSRPEPNTSGAS